MEERQYVLLPWSIFCFSVHVDGALFRGILCAKTGEEGVSLSPFLPHATLKPIPYEPSLHPVVIS